MADSIRTYRGVTPTLGERVYVDPTAVVLGDVVLGDDVSVWPGAVIRGDMHRIRVGARSNVQDNAVLHITHAGQFNPDGFPLTIGEDVVIGHSAVVHGCTVGDRVLIGIGAIVNDGAVVEDEVLVGAGTLVPPGKRLASGYVYVGNPCKQARLVTDREREFFRYSPGNYVRLKDTYLAERRGEGSVGASDYTTP
ncbi:MAG: gamma carbonic anhydrase family protein [Planctomycetota bacterium]